MVGTTCRFWSYLHGRHSAPPVAKTLDSVLRSLWSRRFAFHGLLSLQVNFPEGRAGVACRRPGVAITNHQAVSRCLCCCLGPDLGEMHPRKMKGWYSVCPVTESMVSSRLTFDFCCSCTISLYASCCILFKKLYVLYIQINHLYVLHAALAKE